MCSFPAAWIFAVSPPYKDLAEHMLLELSSLVTSSDIEQENGWTNDQIKSMKDSILTLMKSSGNSSLAEESANAGTVCQMLYAFRTGTQQTNEWKRVHHPPSEDEQGPIDRLVLDTPEQQAKLIFNKAVAKKSSDRVEDLAPFVPDFIGVDNLMNAAGVSPSRFEQAGFKIFQLRLAKQMTSTNKECDDQAKKKSASKMQWE